MIVILITVTCCLVVHRREKRNRENAYGLTSNVAYNTRRDHVVMAINREDQSTSLNDSLPQLSANYYEYISHDSEPAGSKGRLSHSANSEETSSNSGFILEKNVAYI